MQEMVTKEKLVNIMLTGIVMKQKQYTSLWAVFGKYFKIFFYLILSFLYSNLTLGMVVVIALLVIHSMI